MSLWNRIFNPKRHRAEILEKLTVTEKQEVYKGSPQFFHQLAFDDQFKPRSKDGMEYYFTDTAGNRYYRFTDPFQSMHISRLSVIQDFVMELEAGLTKDEIGKFLDTMLAILDGQEEAAVKGRKLGFLIQQMKERKDKIWRKDLLIDLICVCLIREDEKKFTWEVHRDKVEQITKDCSSVEVLHDFLYGSGLSTFLPLSKVTQSELHKYIKDQTHAVSGMTKMLKHLASESKVNQQPEITT